MNRGPVAASLRCLQTDHSKLITVTSHECQYVSNHRYLYPEFNSLFRLTTKGHHGYALLVTSGFPHKETVKRGEFPFVASSCSTDMFPSPLSSSASYHSCYYHRHHFDFCRHHYYHRQCHSHRQCHCHGYLNRIILIIFSSSSSSSSSSPPPSLSPSSSLS